jgi:DNA-binding response OmpR family regulator
MDEPGRILIADDEETFLHSTGDLLRREGYLCDCVPDAVCAKARLAENDYDLLIADIKMPGNPDLELIQEVRENIEGLQVILVTGYPSMQSAIRSINLPVVAYLVKPVDFDEMLSHVRAAIERAKINRTVCQTQRNLRDWLQQLDEVKTLTLDNPGDTIFVPVDAFVTITLRNIVTALTSLRNVTDALAKLSGDQAVCQLLNCPRTEALVEALKDTVDILKKSKSAFKSKEIGELRQKLEDLLEKQP